MNQHLLNIMSLLQQDKDLSGEEKNAIIKSVKDVDKELEIANFKLDRTEKVKKTTAILLEETIEELEQKRKAVEIQNKELGIEAALERVRTVAMGMSKPADLLNISEILYKELLVLGFNELRNALIQTFEDGKDYFLDYDYSDFTGGCISTIPFTGHTAIEKFTREIRESKDAFTELIVTDKELEEWKTFRKANGEADDTRLDNISALYYYNYSIGPASIGISTYTSISQEKRELLKRFRNVFDFAYRRFLDIEKAEAQAREARIEAALEKVRSRSLAMQKSEELKEVIQVVYEQFLHLNINTEHTGFVIDYKQRDDRLIWVAGKRGIPSQLTIPYFDSVYYNSFNEAKEKEWDFFATNLNFEEKNRFYQQLFAYIPGLSGEDKAFYFNCAGLAISTVLLENVALYIENFEGTPYTDEDNDILMRFGKVFQQTYTRFLDLQKAEAQAREATIEMSLERVKLKTMAMHNSKDLKEVITLLSEQFLILGFNIHSANFNTSYRQKDWDLWLYTPGSPMVQDQIHIPYLDHPYFNRTIESIASGADFSAFVFTKEEKDGFLDHIYSNTLAKYASEERKKYTYAGKGFAWSALYLKNTAITIANYDAVPYSEDQNAILRRFGNVFEQTYTRFLDLQKAEAQSRESQIQLALERGRTQSMIMQHSNELDDTLRVFHEQVLLLGINSSFSFLWLPDEEKNNHIFWAAWAEEKDDSTIFKSKAVTYPLDRNEPATAQCLIDWKSSEPVFSYAVPPGGVQSYFAAWQELIDGVEKLTPAHFTNGLYYVEAFMKYGCFGVMLANDLTDNEKKILNRFATEFERVYTRFLDLQKAEAQAKEAKIETGLERVRSRAMAMQASEELNALSGTVFTELTKLDLALTRCVIMIYDPVTNDSRWWMANSEAPDQPMNFLVQYHEKPPYLAYIKAWREKVVKWVYKLEGKIKKDWDNVLFTETGLSQLPGFVIEGMKAPERVYLNSSFFNFGSIALPSLEPLSEEHFDILLRFAKVFDLTYTRFNDLKQAEAQAREAQIEASLERVRSKAMSMQKSDDLANAVAIVFEELDKLNLGMLRCGIGILNKEKRSAQVWTTTISENNTVVQVSGDESMDIHPLLSGAFGAWIKQEDHSYVLEGEDLNNYYRAVARENFKLPDSQSLVAGNEGIRQYYYNAVWSSGGLFAFRATEFPEEAKTVLRRFADVFDFTYTRFNDLKQAEAQATEAKIEVSLERVRSRTLAMQKSDELAETAAVLFQQLIALGIEPNRLYICIVKDDKGNAEFWITDEDGAKVSSAFATNLNDNPTFKRMFEGWAQEKKTLIIDMHGDELQEYFKFLMSINVPFKGGLDQKRRIQDIAYFSNGFIGIASPEEQPVETVSLLERFAAVFNLTYTRFNDLKVAEAHAVQAEEDLIKLQTEKKRAEDALAELQVTQKQLIQSEKMASLGELTAGIAHEIQNPLNFVNNFSEVTNELIEELKEERFKAEGIRDAQLEEDLLNDIKQNLEKINHHGKRADAIVKGMLQHSRASSATKELTDINKLVDEYLRLAYHGLRAKDKSFNATLKTDYDEAIENINVVPQDIGRVVLNLITNAFYAVQEKSSLKDLTSLYEPTVTVSTKKLNDKVEIKVSDNGNGIPQNIIDKIFQPFFTTKPTGQGTGLGLSLAYDIVKAHGGGLKVETKVDEGNSGHFGKKEGTTFIIQLPNQQT